ncbi:ferrous iron transport protein A [Plectonema cf. radiosum LEGE 06105]|uniref:Ferrous iron transport protein A n=1 Tax=Plectonema cf. radiosum LEGE 06105 TaxID=945769 RepID=A0A8J7F0L6_9CYAN|nr:ferrous iron transport protein A [Plectonema radiosum]MBE9213598.1 ferrous iron transport protein A [Plectonema cf. radiosum LEGE 06105]
MQSDENLDNSPEKSESEQWDRFKFFCGNSTGELNQNSNLSDFLDSDDIIPLSEARAGDIVSIVELLSIDCAEDLRNMGLIPGAEIQIISRTTTGSVIIVLQNQPIGLGKDMAKSILVRKNSDKN